MRWLRASQIFLTRKQQYSSSVKTQVKKSEWESVIGLEVHAQIQANSKLFSPSSSSFGSPVNTLVSLFDAAIPGTLPVLNRRCVEAAVETALALSCKLNMCSMFDRKHYFYADLPAGYQITQQRKAIAEHGELKFLVIHPGNVIKPYYKTCAIRQLQLEQDSGKSLHDGENNKSLIDLNRAGIALMEIVFQPELQTGEEAGALVKELILILQAIQTCSCRMEEGSLRVDANISVNRPGEGLGIRTEVKNLSSIRSLVSAVDFEISRQINLIENGGTVVNETRSFDSDLKATLPMRDKEVQQDYRFMPEPNLPPLHLYDDPSEMNNSIQNKVNIACIREKKVVLPDAIRQNLVSTYNLRLETAHTILNIPNLITYYTDVMKNLPVKYGTRAANILLTEVMAELYERDLSFENIPIEPRNIAELADLVEARSVSIPTAQDVLKYLFNGDNRTVIQIVEAEGWLTVKDDKVIEDACKKVLEENQKLVINYRKNGKEKVKQKLIGLVKKSTSVRLDMKKVSDVVMILLNEK